MTACVRIAQVTTFWPSLSVTLYTITIWSRPTPRYTRFLFLGWSCITYHNGVNRSRNTFANKEMKRILFKMGIMLSGTFSNTKRQCQRGRKEINQPKHFRVSFYKLIIRGCPKNRTTTTISSGNTFYNTRMTTCHCLYRRYSEEQYSSARNNFRRKCHILSTVRKFRNEITL